MAHWSVKRLDELDVGRVLASARFVLERSPETDREREALAVLRALRVVMLELLEADDRWSAALARREASEANVAAIVNKELAALMAWQLLAERRTRR